MGDLRISQLVVESLTQQDSAPAERISQLVVEAVSPQAPAPSVRVSQLVIETLSINISPVVLLPSTGSITASGSSPSVLVPQVINIPSGVMTTSGVGPTGSLGFTFLTGAGGLVFNSQAPVSDNTGLPRPATATLNLTGIIPTILVETHAFIVPSTSALVFSGQPPRLFMPAGDDFAALLLY
jgi:hypothetical protein